MKRIILIIATVLTVALAVLATGWRRNHMGDERPTITAIGLNNIGIKLVPAYPDKSWQEVVLINEGERHLIAMVILYEITGRDNARLLARDVICHPQVSLESDPAKLKVLLTKHPVIPPHSSWLAGVGIDRVRLVGELPPFEKTRLLMSQQILADLSDLKSVHITIDAAILEDGRIVGPQTEDIKQWLTQVIQELNEVE